MRVVVALFPFLFATNVALATSPLDVLKSLDYRYFVAGGTCAAISHGITTPIDVVKTKIQANPQKYQKGMLAATADILKTDGAGALLGGLTPTVVGYGIEGAMKFGVYELAKPIFAALMAGGKETVAGETTAVAYLMASVVAGGVAALLLCPMESTRIRIVTDKEYADKGLMSGLPKMIREEGLGNLFAGIWAMLSKQIPYTLGKQVSFDIFAGMMYAFLNQSKLAENQIKWIVSVAAAFCASLVACISSQPGDMILTETYRPERKASTGFRGVIKGIYKVNGIPSFFVGTGARIVHVGLIITSQLVIYDVVKQLLGLPATGSH